MADPVPDLESLRCFLAAAERASFRAAARVVHLSPPAFSDRIRRLEDDLGARLFRRTTRSLALTEAGERLREAARRTLDAADDCRAAVRDAASPLPYALTVGTRFELGMSWLVPALSDLARERPERTLHVYFSNGADLLDRTEAGHLDAMVSSQRLTSARVAYAPLHEEGYVFVGAPRLLARRPLRRPEDAAGHVLLDTSPELPLFRYFLDAHPRGEVWAFGRHERLGTIAAIRHRVLEGAGVAVLPRYFIRSDLAKKRLKILQRRVKLQSDFFRLVWRAGHPRERELQALAESLRQRPLR